MADDKTPPRLWTSHPCYNVIKIFGLCVNQWVQVSELKNAGEAKAKDAVIRCIKAEPEASPSFTWCTSRRRATRSGRRRRCGCASRG